MRQAAKRGDSPDQSWAWLAALALALLVLGQGGCASTPEPGAERKPSPEAAGGIEAATESVQAGDLARARGQLEEARASASGFHQKRQVRSLAKLISGAEALMAGKVKLARAEWSRIEDPYLQRQVRKQAEAIGVAVPLKPMAACKQEIQ